jgi:hypothetical protein
MRGARNIFPLPADPAPLAHPNNKTAPFGAAKVFEFVGSPGRSHLRTKPKDKLVS